MYKTLLVVLMAVSLAMSHVASGQTSDTVPAGAARPAPAAHLESPVIAPIISVFLPGGGQMYAGKVGKGFGLLGLFSVTALIGAAGAVTCAGTYANSGNGDCSRSPVFTAVGVITVGTYLYSIISAPSDVRQYNKRQQARRVTWVRPLIRPGLPTRVGRAPSELGLTVGL